MTTWMARKIPDKPAAAKLRTAKKRPSTKTKATAATKKRRRSASKSKPATSKRKPPASKPRPLADTVRGWPDPHRRLSPAEVRLEARAAAAWKRDAAGKPLSNRDQTAIRQWRDAADERLKWTYLAEHFTKSDVLTIVAMSAKAVNGYAELMGLSALRMPAGAKSASAVVSITDMLAAVFGWIAENRATITHVQQRVASGREAVDISAAHDRVRLDIAEMDRDERRGELVKVTDIRAELEVVGSTIADCCGRLKDEYGEDAMDIVTEAVRGIAAESERIAENAGNGRGSR